MPWCLPNWNDELGGPPRGPPHVLGSGVFGLVHGLRMQFPLLDRGRDALGFLHDSLGAGCSMSKIGDRHLTTVDAVGHGTDGEHAVGQRFPIDPPFGLVAMAWRDEDSSRPGCTVSCHD